MIPPSATMVIVPPAADSVPYATPRRPADGNGEPAARRPGGPAGRLAIGCMALLLVAVSPRAEPGGIYGYTTEDGAVYLSNIPDDERYSPLILDKAEPPASRSGASLAKQPATRSAADILSLIDQAARDRRVDSALLQAVVTAESGYDARAVSGKGAMGLMQLMPDTASRYGIADPYDPAQNLDAGARHLRYLLERYQCDLSLTLAAYNAGEGAVRRHGNNIPPYRETLAYVPRVLGLYEKLRNGPSPTGNGVSPRPEYSVCPMGSVRLAANL
jgi:soluble lytic murein transglycosylase-like protein